MAEYPIKCDICGKFIPYKELMDGTSLHHMITPDSDWSSEEWESLCKKHYKAEKIKRIYE